MFVAGAGVGAALFCLEPEPVQESAPGPWASVAGVGAAQKKRLYHKIRWLGLRTTG